MSRMIRLAACVAVATSWLAMTSQAVMAAKLVQVFPELAERKATLGRTLLLVDVALVDDIAGKVEKVKLGRSWEVAAMARDSLRDALVQHGFPIDSAIVATIGQGLGLASLYQSDSVEAKGTEDSEHTIRPPFYVDSLFADPELRAQWRGFIGSAWEYNRKKKAPPGYLPEPIPLGSRLGYDTIVLFYGASWGIPKGKQFLAALANVSVSSTTTYKMVIADARSGQVLWSQVEVFEASATPGNLKTTIERISRALP